MGRLATYKYYNMDQVVAQALTLYSKIRQKKSARGKKSLQCGGDLSGAPEGLSLTSQNGWTSSSLGQVRSAATSTRCAFESRLS